MRAVLTSIFFALPLLLIFQGCSYLDTVMRARENDKLKGTKTYYDNKCMVAEECAGLSGRITIPAESPADTLAIAVVLEDGDDSRVIDADVIDFTPVEGTKVSYYFFNLPVGDYTFYVLKTADGSGDFEHAAPAVVAQESGRITKEDLHAYQNAIIVDDVKVDPDLQGEGFSYSLDEVKGRLAATEKSSSGAFEENVDLNDPIFSHEMAMEGLYYPESFRNKTQPLYRLAPAFKEGSIPLIFVHGIAGTPRDWEYMLNHIDMEHYTPYVVYYPSGEDFTKLSTLFNGWLLSDKIFDSGPAVVVAHSFGGIIVRDAFNMPHPEHDRLFISIASPFGGDEKASEGVKNAPYVIPSWRSIADKGDFIRNLYRSPLASDETYELIFAYDNGGKGVSGDGRVPLKKQLRREAYDEAQSLRGFNEDHLSILRSQAAAAYINTLLQQFAREHLKN